MKVIVASLLLLSAISLFAPQSVSAVTIDWSPVGNPGNAADPADGDGGTAGIENFGAVPYAYNIGKYDVTASQYVEFLNAKDSTGLNSLGLYNSGMSNVTFGGINFSAGNANGSKYSAISGRENHPVSDVNWYDAIRFANWLNNGQGNGDTESGAYTLLGGTPVPSNGLGITRNAGATVFLPSENEWYKAAFYDPETSSYFRYPTSSDIAPTATGPTTTPNSANYDNAVGNLTDVGAYSGTTSPYGAFDMGGNVYQWNEALIFGFVRGVRGGWFNSAEGYGLSSSDRVNSFPADSTVLIGFRVASVVPEPNTFVLAIFAFGMMLWWRMRLR